MQFYLVTQTILVEAENAEAAAQDAVDQLRAGNQIVVAVKADETTITHVVIPAQVQTVPEVAEVKETPENKAKLPAIEEISAKPFSVRRILSSVVERLK